MSSLAETLARIDGSPPGERVGAFVDLDGTLMSGYTASAFYRDRLRHGDIGSDELVRSAAVIADSVVGGDAARLGPIAVAGLAGRRADDLHELGERLYRRELAANVRPEMREIVRAHQARGHTVVLATSATQFQAAPVAADLDVDELLCSEVEVRDGALTGSFSRGMLWGPAKAATVRATIDRLGLDADESFAYANGDEDVSLLAGVGRPHAVHPEGLLERVARLEDWPVLRFANPNGSVLRRAVSTAAAIGGMNAALAVGAGLAVVGRNRRAAANLAAGPALDLALLLSGVQLRVTGRENLWKDRPAVFVFNHQSNLDPLVVGALVRRDFTATGKKEAKWDPSAILVGRLVDTAYLDRERPAAAKEELNRLVARIAHGESVIIAPEGTRSATARLLPFKHGAFHLALEAGVPIVPVVLRNTARLMAPSASTIRSGVADICVLDPVATDGWKARDIALHAENVRNRIQETLERWPGDDDA